MFFDVLSCSSMFFLAFKTGWLRKPLVELSALGQLLSSSIMFDSPGPPNRCNCRGSISKAQCGHRMWLGSWFGTLKGKMKNGSKANQNSILRFIWKAHISSITWLLRARQIDLRGLAFVFHRRLWLRWCRALELVSEVLLKGAKASNENDPCLVRCPCCLLWRSDLDPYHTFPRRCRTDSHF